MGRREAAVSVELNRTKWYTKTESETTVIHHRSRKKVERGARGFVHKLRPDPFLEKAIQCALSYVPRETPYQIAIYHQKPLAALLLHSNKFPTMPAAN